MKIDWESSENHSLINPRFPKDQKEFLLGLVDQVSSQFQAHVFILSSGTTSQVNQSLKWVALSKKAILSSAAAVNQHLQCSSSDVWIQSLPEFHVGGLGIRARSDLSQSRVVSLLKWDPAEFVSLAEREKATLTALVPTQVYDLVQRGLRCPSSLRALPVGGGAFTYPLFKLARELGWPVLPTYGMSETCSQIATTELDFKEYDAVINGFYPRLQILPHLQVSTDTEGRFKIKGNSLLSGYVFAEKGQAKVSLLSDQDSGCQGWFQTQDRGQVLDAKSLFVFGRTGDFIKVGGESVEMGSLRQVLEGLRFEAKQSGGDGSSVFDLELVPLQEERFGHVVGVISNREAPDDVVRHLIHRFNEKVMPFERIRHWYRIGEIPRSPLGKLILARCYEQMSLSRSEIFSS